MNCSKCGTPLNEGAAFCPNCGEKVAAPTPNPTPAPTPVDAAASAQTAGTAPTPEANPIPTVNPDPTATAPAPLNQCQGRYQKLLQRSRKCKRFQNYQMRSEGYTECNDG